MSATVHFLPPIKGNAYCGCGCGYRETHAVMSNCPHPGFGAVNIYRDNEIQYPWSDGYITDWRVRVDGPLSDHTYQRQGKGVWALVEQGQGFA